MSRAAELSGADAHGGTWVQASTIINLRSAASAECQEPPERRQRGEQGRSSPTERYSLVSAVSYSLSRSSSKMSTSTLAFPARSGARLMRFLARVMESRSPLLHSIGSSRMAAVGSKGDGRGQAQEDFTHPKPPAARPPGSPVPCQQPLQRHRCSCQRILPPAPGLSRRFAHLQALPDTGVVKSLQQRPRYLPARCGCPRCSAPGGASTRVLRMLPQRDPGCAAPGSTDQGTAPHPDTPRMKESPQTAPFCS